MANEAVCLALLYWRSSVLWRRSASLSTADECLESRDEATGLAGLVLHLLADLGGLASGSMSEDKDESAIAEILGAV